MRSEDLGRDESPSQGKSSSFGLPTNLILQVPPLLQGDSNIEEYTEKFYELSLRVEVYESGEALSSKYRASLSTTIQYDMDNF